MLTVRRDVGIFIVAPFDPRIIASLFQFKQNPGGAVFEAILHSSIPSKSDPYSDVTQSSGNN
jgi:hypothetical protein